MTSETMAIDWEDLRRRHSNRLRAGDLPVVPWDEFVVVAEDMVDAAGEFRRAMDGASAHLDRLVPVEDRYCAWYCYAPGPVVAIYDLFGAAPIPLHPSDFRFDLTYGKAKRSPLGYMRRRADGFRAYARKVDRTLAKNLVAAEAALADSLR